MTAFVYVSEEWGAGGSTQFSIVAVLGSFLLRFQV
jgi:hypothetical protein